MLRGPDWETVDGATQRESFQEIAFGLGGPLLERMFTWAGVVALLVGLGVVRGETDAGDLLSRVPGHEGGTAAGQATWGWDRYALTLESGGAEGGGASGAVLSACACGCGVFDVGTSSMLPQGTGGVAWFEYDYQNQNRNRSGGSSRRRRTTRTSRSGRIFSKWACSIYSTGVGGRRSKCRLTGGSSRR